MSDARYRLLLFDLDGTLLTPERTIHPSVAATLTSLMQAGLAVGFATGRPPRSVRPYVEALAPTGPNVCFNGGLVWDVAAARALDERTLDLDVAVAALARARALDVHANLYVADDIFIEERSDTSRASATKDGVEQVEVGELAPWLSARDEGPTKILFIGPDAALLELERAIASDDDTSVLVRSEPTYLEMLPPGTSKGAALDAVAEHLRIGVDQIIAFGDNLNDLELLQRAGLGVAMANAHEQLRAVADVVIGDHATDAIARFISEDLRLIDGALVRA